MTQNSDQQRRADYFQRSSQLIQIDNAQLQHLFASNEAQIGWGQSQTLTIEGNKFFVKRIPMTDLEFNNMFSTKNLYDLPTYYNYGVGSAGFGIFRELVAHVKTTNWVLNGEIATFPLLYHYRVIPFSGECIEVDPEEHERYVTYWGGNEKIGQYLLDKRNANYELVLFLEYIPHVLEHWLMDHCEQIDDVLEQLRLSIHFLGKRDVIHFDANFDNILTDGERVYLTDFGLVLDREFALSDTEKAFFAAHTSYDYGLVLANLMNLLHELCQLLPESEQQQLREQFGAFDAENQFRNLIMAVVENLEEIGTDGPLHIHPTYLACLLRYRRVGLLMQKFRLDLRENNQKDTPFPHAEIQRLLVEANFWAD